MRRYSGREIEDIPTVPEDLIFMELFKFETHQEDSNYDIFQTWISC